MSILYTMRYGNKNTVSRDHSGHTMLHRVEVPEPKEHLPGAEVCCHSQTSQEGITLHVPATESEIQNPTSVSTGYISSWHCCKADKF